MTNTGERFVLTEIDADEKYTIEVFVEKMIRFLKDGPNVTEEAIQKAIADTRAGSSDEKLNSFIKYKEQIPGFEDTFWYKKPSIVNMPFTECFDNRGIDTLNSAFRRRPEGSDRVLGTAYMYCESATYDTESGGYIFKMVEPYRTIYSEPIQKSMKAALYCTGHIVRVTISVMGDNDFRITNIEKVLPYSMHHKIVKDWMPARDYEMRGLEWDGKTL